jgi:hypothetical protein
MPSPDFHTIGALRTEIAPMASFVHLTVQNATPQQRGIFVMGRKLDTIAANSIGLGAWQRFVLAPGESDRTALMRQFQIVARSRMPEAQHQTISAEAAPGSAWDFGLDADNAPILTEANQSATGDLVTITNRSTGAAAIGFHNNAALLFPATTVEAGEAIERGPAATLYFYATVPLVEERQPIVLATQIGEFAVSAAATRVTAQFRQDNNVLEWRFT